VHGEIEYFTATGMDAADQAGIQGIAPYVEVLGPDGRWKKVIDDLGFPAGGARTMTADLSGMLRVGTKRIRITTNLQIYWDNILISRTPQKQKARLTSVPLTRADLRFHGFPLKTEGDPPGNVKYVYEEASATGPYTRPVGAYTRYGDVRDRKSTRLNSSHSQISYAVFCLKKKQRKSCFARTTQPPRHRCRTASWPARPRRSRR